MSRRNILASLSVQASVSGRERERKSASCMINMLLDFLEWDVVECEIISYFDIYSYYLRAL